MAGVPHDETFEDLGYTDGGVFTQLGVNIVLCMAVLLVWNVLRTRPINKNFYYGRCDPRNLSAKLAAPATEAEVGYPSDAAASSFVAAVKETWGATDSQILRRSGLESAMYVMYLRAMAHYMIVLSALCVCVLLPINASQDWNFQNAKNENIGYNTGFPDWTVNNVEPGSWTLWVHCAVMVFLTYYTHFTLNFMSRRMFDLSNEWGHIRNDRRSVSSHTVMVKGLPVRELVNGDPIVTHINRTFSPESVFEAQIVYNTPGLFEAHEKKKELMQLLRYYRNLWKYRQKKQGSGAKRPMRKTACWGLCGAEEDAEEWCLREIDSLLNSIMQGRSKPALLEAGSSDVAFVTFQRVLDMQRFLQNYFFKFEKVYLEEQHPEGVGAGLEGKSKFGLPSITSIERSVGDLTKSLLTKTQIIPRASPLKGDAKSKVGQYQAPSASASTSAADSRSEELMGDGARGDSSAEFACGRVLTGTHWRVERAPETSQIIWRNLSLVPRERDVRWILSFAFVSLVVLFYTVPLAYLSDISNLATTPVIGVLFKWIIDDWPPSFVAWLSAYLPVLLVLTLIQLVPIIFRLVFYYEGLVTWQEIEMKTSSRFTTFLVFANVIFPRLLVNVQILLGDIYDKPVDAIQQMLWQVSTPDKAYFIVMVTQLAMFTVFMQLIRSGSFLKRNAMLLVASTPQDKLDADKLESYEFSREGYPYTVMVVVIALLFCITLPLTTPFCALYFVTKLQVDKHLLIYHYPAPTPSKHSGKMLGDTLLYVHFILILFQLGAAQVFTGKEAYYQSGVGLGCVVYSIYHYYKFKSNKIDLLNRKDFSIADRDTYAGEPKILDSACAAQYRGAYQHPSLHEDLIPKDAQYDEDATRRSARFLSGDLAAPAPASSIQTRDGGSSNPEQMEQMEITEQTPLSGSPGSRKSYSSVV
jgi:hypothetical protein